MSYLTLAQSNVPNFSKAVISLWFRVPQASMTAAYKAYSSEQFHSNPLVGIIPLVIMGQKGLAANGVSTAPTYIGVDCRGGASITTTSFVVNFETNQKANTTDYSPGTDTMVLGGGHANFISPDKWHHALMSLDFSAIATHGFAWDEPLTGDITSHIDAIAHFYMAFDDVNLLGAELSADNPFGYGDLNAVTTPDALAVANSIQNSVIPPDPHDPPYPVGGIPHYSATGGTIPASGQPMGLPGTSEFEGNIYHVEMAEFQMFTGIAINTGDTTMRRAFINEDGKPVPPDRKQSKDADGKVTGDSGSIEKLGKKPDVMLHGQSKWISGANTGTTGVDKDGEKIPGGQFTPTAKIKKFKPEPQLGK